MDDQNIKELICEVKYSNMNYAAKKLLIKMLEEKSKSKEKCAIIEDGKLTGFTHKEE